MERSKIRPTDNLRCFFLARFFLEYFLLLRSKAAAKNEGKVPEDADLSLGLVGEMAEMESVRWVVMRMKYTMDDKVSGRDHVTGTRELKKAACLEGAASEYRLLLTDCKHRSSSLVSCAHAQLLLIDSMASSDEEDDVDVANTLQEQLYYNGDILDSCLLVISQYKDQSVG